MRTITTIYLVDERADVGKILIIGNRTYRSLEWLLRVWETFGAMFYLIPLCITVYTFTLYMYLQAGTHSIALYIPQWLESCQNSSKSRNVASASTAELLFELLLVLLLHAPTLSPDELRPLSSHRFPLLSHP